MASMTTGNTTVDAIAQLNLEGNVTPMSWYQHIKYTNLKGTFTDTLAIALLADLVYWHRPSEVRDEATGHVIGWKKKFKGEHFQRNLEAYSNLFGVSYKQIISAADNLEATGAAYRFTENIRVKGRLLGNVLYWGINPDAIAKITYRVDPEVLKKSTKPKYKSPEKLAKELADRAEKALLKQSKKQAKKPNTPNRILGTEDQSPNTPFGIQAISQMGGTYTDINSGDSRISKQKHKQAEESHSSPLECEKAQPQNEEQENRLASIDSNPLSREEAPREEVRQSSNEANLDTEVKTNQSRRKTNTKTKQSGEKDKQNPPAPLSRRAAQNEVIPISVRVQKSKTETIAFRVNDVGWLQLPRSKRYVLARGIAVRRVQHQLAILFVNIDYARSPENIAICNGNQMGFQFDEKVRYEGELMNRSASMNLTSVRDQIVAKQILPQAAFNDLLESIFLDSVRWCNEQGAIAQSILSEQSVFELFGHADMDLTRSIREKYEVEA